MKKLIIFLVIVIGAIASLPWIDGIYTKKHYLNLLASMSQNNHMKMEIVEYRTGWLKSHVKIRFLNVIPPSQADTFAVNGKSTSANEIMLDETITHGPYVFDPVLNKMAFALARIDSKLHLPANIESVLLGAQSPDGILQVSSVISFNGNRNALITSPKINMRLPNDTNVSWNGIQGTATINITNNQIYSGKTNVTLGALTIIGTDPKNPTVQRQLSLQPIKINYDGALDPIGVWAANISITVPQLAVKSSDGNNVSIENLNMSASTNVSSDSLINVTEKLTLNKLEIPGSPAIIISPANVAISANNLSAKGILALFNFLQTVSNNQSMLTPTQLNSQYLTLLAGIITPSTSLNSAITMNTSLGALSVQGNASLPPKSASPTSVNEAIVSGNAQLEIRVSALLANKIMEGVYDNTSGKKEEAKVAAVTAQSKDDFNQKIAEMMQSGKLDLANAMQIMDMYTQRMPAEQFSAEIAKYNLPPETLAEVNQLYTGTKSQTEAAKAAIDAPSADKAKTTIQSWIQQGYLIPENDGYVIKVSQEAGVIKINGTPLQLGSPETTQPAIPDQASDPTTTLPPIPIQTGGLSAQ